MTGKDKRYLRKLANTLDAKFQIGKLGLNEEIIEPLNVYLEKHELVKINILGNCPFSKEEIVKSLEENEFIVAGTIGHKIIVYKESKEHKTIIFPK